MGLFRDKKIIQIEHNMFKNPNWQEANQLAIYKRGRGFELGTTNRFQEQIQLAVRAGLQLGASGLQVQRSHCSATLPPRYGGNIMGYGKLL